jgi:hypothetical protein
LCRANVAFNHSHLIKRPKMLACGSALTLGEKKQLYKNKVVDTKIEE